jgi:hypothetical protein
MLDEFCKVTEYHRKYAVRRMSGPPPGGGLLGSTTTQGDRESGVDPDGVWEAAGYRGQCD